MQNFLIRYNACMLIGWFLKIKSFGQKWGILVILGWLLCLTVTAVSFSHEKYSIVRKYSKINTFIQITFHKYFYRKIKYLYINIDLITLQWIKLGISWTFRLNISNLSVFIGHNFTRNLFITSKWLNLERVWYVLDFWHTCKSTQKKKKTYDNIQKN